VNGIDFGRVAVLVVFVFNGLLMLSLIVGKGVHRRRIKSHERRRVAYLTLLSRQLAAPDRSVEMGSSIAGDPAFLDALIDIRTSVVGSESDELSWIVGRHGVMETYARRLERRFPVTPRLNAAVALAEVADESWAPLLMDHLGDREPEIRIQAARGLARVKWTPAIDAIVERFGVETPWVRTRFEDTLLTFGSKATWPLVAYVRVNHKFDSSGPAAAIRTIGRIGDRDAVQSLIAILQSSQDPEIQIAAIEALGILGVPLAMPSLERTFLSDDWRLRAKTATALAMIAEREAIPILTTGLEDPNWWVRRNSAAGLARHREGIRNLHKAIQSTDPFARDAAAEALADVGEVIAARERIDAGSATVDDVELIRFIESELAVKA